MIKTPLNRIAAVGKRPDLPEDSLIIVHPAMFAHVLQEQCANPGLFLSSPMTIVGKHKVLADQQCPDDGIYATSADRLSKFAMARREAIANRMSPPNFAEYMMFGEREGLMEIDAAQ